MARVFELKDAAPPEGVEVGEGRPAE